MRSDWRRNLKNNLASIACFFIGHKNPQVVDETGIHTWAVCERCHRLHRRMYE
jgi:hypothetical protein